GQLKILRIEIRFIQIDQTLHEPCIIVQKARNCSFPAPETAKEHAVDDHVMHDEIGSTTRRFGISRFLQDCTCLRESRNHESVPTREDLVIEVWTDTLGTRRQQLVRGPFELPSDALFIYFEVVSCL